MASWTHHPGAVAAGSRLGLVLGLVLALFGTLPTRASAQQYSPEHTRVRVMVERGLAFLEANSENERRLGGMSLVGLAMLKADRPASHPLIQRAVAECRQQAREMNSPGYALDIYPNDAIYNIALAVVFLSELDPVEYRPQIDALFGWLLKAQKASGGWGYPTSHPEGALHADTSMSQYVALACWSVRNYGASEVSDKVVKRLCAWLVRTQDPSGAWGYQGVDPGPAANRRVPQNEIRPSLVAAALGSVYICGDFLDIDMRGVRSATVRTPALRLVEEERPARRGSNSTNATARSIRRALMDGNEWLRQNFVINPDSWTHYYLYALERAQSFAELGSGGYDAELNWYDRGVEYLEQTQAEDGSWTSEGGTVVDTSFAVLFLLRATRRSIERAATAYDGLLRGGRGLPSDTQDVKLQGGRLVRSELTMRADALLELLDDDDFRAAADLLAAEYDIELSDNQSVRRGQLQRLGQGLRVESQPKRLAAVRVLAAQRDMATVPDLIYALSDPDPEVARVADEALRAISRRPDAPRWSPDASPGERESVINHWRAWFDSVRPSPPDK